VRLGSESYIEEVKNRLGLKAKARSIVGGKDHYHLRENVRSFGNTSLHGFESVTGWHSEMINTFLWGDKS
jgi:hypothetical protein